MTTTIEPLGHEDWETLHRLATTFFLDGECYAFAIALQRGLGWPMWGLVITGIVRHVGVRNPKNNLLFDVRGPVSDEDFQKPFVTLPHRHGLKPVTEGRLRARRKVPEHTINKALELAEVLWPDLPWRHTTCAAKVQNFLDELEGLSRKHGLWVRAPYPAGKPVIGPSYGDEAGYTAGHTADGLAFIFDRQLK